MDEARESPTLRDQHKQRVRNKIVESAVSLVAKNGLGSVTADHIAVEAEVGRATFFRYFGSKEEAVIVGFYEQRLTALVEALEAAPAKLSPMDAVIWTFRELSAQPVRHVKMLRLHARMVTSSPALRAKAYEFQTRYETAIADAVAPRYRHTTKDDLRPRLLATATLAVLQSCIEHWASRKDSVDLSELTLSALEQLKGGFGETA